MATNNRRAFAQYDRDFARLERAPVQIAEIAEGARRAGRQDAVAEVVLAASIELYVGGQRVAIFVEERDEPAVVIEVAVADDKRIDLPWVGPEIIEIGKKRRWRIGVIEHYRVCLAFPHRLEQKRQAKFRMQRSGVILRSVCRHHRYAVQKLGLKEEVGVDV